MTEQKNTLPSSVGYGPDRIRVRDDAARKAARSAFDYGRPPWDKRSMMRQPGVDTVERSDGIIAKNQVQKRAFPPVSSSTLDAGNFARAASVALPIAVGSVAAVVTEAPQTAQAAALELLDNPIRSGDRVLFPASIPVLKPEETKPVQEEKEAPKGPMVELFAQITQKMARDSVPAMEKAGFNPKDVKFYTKDWNCDKENNITPTEYQVTLPDGTKVSFGMASFVEIQTDGSTKAGLVVIGGDPSVNSAEDVTKLYRVLSLQPVANQVGGDIVAYGEDGIIVLKEENYVNADGTKNPDSHLVYYDPQSAAGLPVSAVLHPQTSIFSYVIADPLSSEEKPLEYSLITPLPADRPYLYFVGKVAPVLNTEEVQKRVSTRIDTAKVKALNFREGFGTNYNLIGTIGPDEEVTVLAKTPNNWVKVSIVRDGKIIEGFVNPSYLKDVDLGKLSGLEPKQIEEIKNKTPLPVAGDKKPAIETNKIDFRNLSPEEITAIQRGERGIEPYIQLLLPKFNTKDSSSKYPGRYDSYTGFTDNEIIEWIGVITRNFDVFNPDEKQRPFLPSMIGASRKRQSSGSRTAICLSTEYTGRSNEIGYSDDTRHWLGLAALYGHEWKHAEQEDSGRPISEQEAYSEDVRIAEKFIPLGLESKYVDEYRKKS